MIEFGILELSCLLNKLAGLTQGGKAKHKQKSSYNALIYCLLDKKASMKTHSPLAQGFARDPSETVQTGST
jgi:hypothetical protein